MNTTALYSEEAIKEIDAFVNTKKAFVGTDGKFNNSIATDTVNLLFHNILGD